MKNETIQYYQICVNGNGHLQADGYSKYTERWRMWHEGKIT